MSDTTKLAKLLSLHQALEERKALYAELDALVLELQSEGFSHAVFEGLEITLVDNFAAANTVFRPAGVKRYEAKFKKIKGAV